jgi:S1-C subfamily serine protease/predicted esterase
MNPIATLRRVTLVLLASLFILALPAPAQDARSVNAAIEKSLKAAAAKAAPSIVKIDTSGGLEKVGSGKKAILRGTGATTGLIVDPDGYIITSSFNFANKPTAIAVSIPGQKNKLDAKVIGTDETRMLTLLKVNATGLAMPVLYPKKDVKVGQWAIALGRTLSPNLDQPPSFSTGIISAVNRLWGKAIQTDAKISPANYGGPLIAMDGRVFGVLVPASTRSEGETAGFEWYDSGIGFAIPLEDILAALPRMKEGTETEVKELRRGLLGINPASPDQYNTAPVIGAIQPDSAAAHAGLQVGDKILAIDDKPTPNFSTVQHILGPKYDGDKLSLKIERDGKELEIENIVLQGTATAYVRAFLGILPLRDDPTPGVQVRFVYPKSPADAAGLKEGDRITKIGRADKSAKGKTAMIAVRNRQQLTSMLAQLAPGAQVSIEVKRKEGEKVETVTATLATVPDEIPEKLPMPSSAGKALESAPKAKSPFPPAVIPMPKKKGDSSFLPAVAPAPSEVFAVQDDPFKKKPAAAKKGKTETGYIVRRDESLGREYWLYIPENYDANTSHGLLVWFHPPMQGGKDGERMAKTFAQFCQEHHYILMGPKSQNLEGWIASETELVMTDVKRVLGEYTIDRTRVAAHGMGKGGEMAFYVGFQARDVFRGVATVGSTLETAPKENVANQPLAFFLAAGAKDPLLAEIEASKKALLEKKLPVSYRVMKEIGKEYLDGPTFAELLVWLDSLDRI